MKRKKTIIVLLTIIIILANCSVVLADINPDDYRPVIRSDDAGDAIGLAQKIIGVINVVGTIILVITVIVLGIKYMLGSVEQRADYKKTMVPVLVGAILLFGTSWIIKLIYDIIPNTVSAIS